MLKLAHKSADASYRRSQATQHQNSTQEALHRKSFNFKVNILLDIFKKKIEIINVCFCVLWGNVKIFIPQNLKT